MIIFTDNHFTMSLLKIEQQQKPKRLPYTKCTALDNYSRGHSTHGHVDILDTPFPSEDTK